MVQTRSVLVAAHLRTQGPVLVLARDSTSRGRVSSCTDPLTSLVRGEGGGQGPVLVLSRVLVRLAINGLTGGPVLVLGRVLGRLAAWSRRLEASVCVVACL